MRLRALGSGTKDPMGKWLTIVRRVASPDFPVDGCRISVWPGAETMAHRPSMHERQATFTGTKYAENSDD
jgi:hypothetical protein